eukprot:2835059-Rhodomonas_salina.1
MEEACAWPVRIVRYCPTHAVAMLILRYNVSWRRATLKQELISGYDSTRGRGSGEGRGGREGGGEDKGG